MKKANRNLAVAAAAWIEGDHEADVELAGALVEAGAIGDDDVIESIEMDSPPDLYVVLESGAVLVVSAESGEVHVVRQY